MHLGIEETGKEKTVEVENRKNKGRVAGNDVCSRVTSCLPLLMDKKQGI